MYLEKRRANKVTGPNAGGRRQFPIRTPLAARVGQFCRSAEKLMRILIIMAAFFSSLGRLFGGGDKPQYEVADVYSGLREQILNLTYKDIAELKGKPVWAVLVEMGRPNAAVTILAVADGTASLYFSNGGGMIGLGEHANVRPQSLKLVELAGTEVKKMKKVEAFPLPAPSEIRFYVVTPGGVLSALTTEAKLEDRRHEFHSLFAQTHELITQMRIADQRRQAEQDGGGQPATRPESK